MEKLQESFLNKYASDDFIKYLEDYRLNKLLSREDYKEILDNISEIKNNNPKLRDFLEEREEIEFSKLQQKALLDILTQQEELDNIEKKEIFKLGFKEAYIFFKEMNLLEE